MSDQFQQAVLADGFEPHCYSGRGRNVYRKAQEIDGERLYGVFEVGQLTLEGVAQPLDVKLTGAATVDDTEEPSVTLTHSGPGLETKTVKLTRRTFENVKHVADRLKAANA